MKTGTSADGRTIIGVNLKMYFGHAETRRWLEELRTIIEQLNAGRFVDVFVLPSFTSVPTAREVLRGSGIAYGAQDVAWAERGAFTGEVSAEDLRELGCTVTAVGHAERRQLFGEDDDVTARKAAALTHAGITPIACIGETVEGSIDDAVTVSRRQIDAVLDAVPDDADLVFAYEPVWAIGAPAPAVPDRIVDVARRLREAFAHRHGRTRLMYGGSAGPGLYPRIADAVNGVFFGRFVHDTHNLRAALTEVIGEAVKT